MYGLRGTIRLGARAVKSLWGDVGFLIYSIALRCGFLVNVVEGLGRVSKLFLSDEFAFSVSIAYLVV